MVVFMAKNEKQNDAMEKGKPAEIQLPKVRITCHGAHAVYYPGRGMKTYAQGDVAEFDPHDAMELRALLCIVKMMNRKKTNAYIVVTDKNTNETKRMERFTLPDDSGFAKLPKVLQEHVATMDGGYTDKERDAIKTLVPDFPFEKKRQTVVIQQ